MRITVPTPIQAAVIPDALRGLDVLGKAPTGSGKTLAFGLPLLALVGDAQPRRPRALVLAPTRELAEQIKRDLLPVAVAVDRRLVAIYGGVGMGPQVTALRNGADVVIATPGRLLDLIDQGEVSLDRVDRAVIDEADRMADMGFLPDVKLILDMTGPKRQTLLFSATLDSAVAILTKQYQHNPTRHSVGGDEPDITQMSHRFVRVERSGKVAMAADVIDDHGSTMVFCRTRHGVDRVCRQLKRMGVKAAWIHGGRSQNQRDAALAAFVDGRARALIATDVAARGIHVDDVACVLHYDPPADAKDYVHRSGRTARAGSTGDVISFVTDDQVDKILVLQRQVGLSSAIETMSKASNRSGAVPVSDADLGLAARSNRAGQSPRRSRSADERQRPIGRSNRSTGPSKTKGSRGSRRSKRPVNSTESDASEWSSSRVGRPDEAGKRTTDESRSGADRRGQKRRSSRPPTRGGKPGSPRRGKAASADPKRTSKRSGKPRPRNKGGGHGR